MANLSTATPGKSPVFVICLGSQDPVLMAARIRYTAELCRRYPRRVRGVIGSGQPVVAGTTQTEGMYITLQLAHLGVPQLALFPPEEASRNTLENVQNMARMLLFQFQFAELEPPELWFVTDSIHALRVRLHINETFPEVCLTPESRIKVFACGVLPQCRLLARLRHELKHLLRLWCGYYRNPRLQLQP